MAYRALSIDTNILYGHGFDFEQGLVGHLARFAASPTAFLLTDVVRREFLKHVREQTDKTHETLSTTARKAIKQGLLPADGAAAATFLEQLTDPGDAALEQIDKFIAMTRAEVVDDAHASIGSVMQLYFEQRPPFEAVGDKKAEFPDAVALLALEGWARGHGRVLVVSRDAGWKKYADGSKLIDVVDNLGHALGLIQNQDEAEATLQAASTVKEILAGMAAGRLPRLASAFAEHLTTMLSELDLYPDGNSQDHAEGELTEVEVDQHEIVGSEEDGFEIDIVRLDRTVTVFTIPIRAELTVSANFTFYRWGWEHGHVRRGKQSMMRALSLDEEVLVTLRGSLDDPDMLTLESLELVSPPTEVHFGDIELEDEGLDRQRAALLTIID